MTPPVGRQKGSREAAKGPRSHDPGSGATDPNPKLPRASGYVREALRRVTRSGRSKWRRKYPYLVRISYRGLRPDREKELFGSRVFSAAYCEATQRRDLVLGCKSFWDGTDIVQQAQRHFPDCRMDKETAIACAKSQP